MASLNIDLLEDSILSKLEQGFSDTILAKYNDEYDLAHNKDRDGDRLENEGVLIIGDDADRAEDRLDLKKPVQWLVEIPNEDDAYQQGTTPAIALEAAPITQPDDAMKKSGVYEVPIVIHCTLVDNRVMKQYINETPIVRSIQESLKIRLRGYEAIIIELMENKYGENPIRAIYRDNSASDTTTFESSRISPTFIDEKGEKYERVVELQYTFSLTHT